MRKTVIALALATSLAVPSAFAATRGAAPSTSQIVRSVKKLLKHFFSIQLNDDDNISPPIPAPTPKP